MKINILHRWPLHISEKTIHRILELRGKHIESAQGDEWFRTNPDIVLEIYQDLRSFDRRPLCEMEMPEKNPDGLLAQTNSLCYKRAACVSPTN